jgi:hypothetical protein
MLCATSDDLECGMWNLECGVTYRRENLGLICNFFIDGMKVGTDQWEWKKKNVACWEGSHCVE